MKFFSQTKLDTLKAYMNLLEKTNSTEIPNIDLYFDTNPEELSEFLNQRADQVAKLILKLEKSNKSKDLDSVISQHKDQLNGIVRKIEELKRASPQNLVTISFPIFPSRLFQDLNSTEIELILSTTIFNMQKSSEGLRGLQNKCQDLKRTRDNILDLINKMPLEELNIDIVDTLVKANDFSFAALIVSKYWQRVSSELDSNSLIRTELGSNAKIIELSQSLYRLCEKHQDVDIRFQETKEAIPIDKIRKILQPKRKAFYESLLREKSNLDLQKSRSRRLVESEFAFLNVLSDSLDGIALDPIEKDFLYQMIEKSIGDMNFNRMLINYQRNKDCNPKHAKAINLLKEFSYRTRDEFGNDKLSNLSDIIEKAQYALYCYKNGEKDLSNYQVILPEFRALLDMVKIKNFLDFCYESGVIKEDSKLENLYRLSQKSCEFISQIEKSELTQYQPGDIIAVNAKKFSKFQSETPGWLMQKATDFVVENITKYRHAAQIFYNEKLGSLRIAHILDRYRTNDFVMSDILTGYIFRVDPINLMKEEDQHLLEQHYKKKEQDWKEEIRKIYRDILQVLHTGLQGNFNKIENSIVLRAISGISEFLPNTFSFNPGVIRNSMYGLNGMSNDNKKMICSEFVARNLITAFVEFREQMIKILEKDVVLKDLISTNQEIGHIHPQGLIDSLKRSGCLEQINTSNSLLEYVENSKPILLYDALLAKAKLIASSSKDKENFIANISEILEGYFKSQQILGQNPELDINFPKIKELSENLYKASIDPNLFEREFRNAYQTLKAELEIVSHFKKDIFGAHTQRLSNNAQSGLILTV